MRFSGYEPCKISGGDSERDPPVPIPNTEVKPFSADGTWLETARESRTLPDSTKEPCFCRVLFLCPSAGESLYLKLILVVISFQMNGATEGMPDDEGKRT